MIRKNEVGMRAKLTKRTIDAIPIPARRLRVFDTTEKGFLLDITPRGVRTFYVRYRTAEGRGAPIDWLNLGEHGAVTVDQARAAAKDVKARVARGEQPARERKHRRDAETLSQILPSFLADARARRKVTTAHEYERLFNRDVVPVLGSRRPGDIAAADLARLHVAMSDRPYMANRVLSALGAFFTWCELHGHRPKRSNPGTAWPARARRAGNRSGRRQCRPAGPGC